MRNIKEIIEKNLKGKRVLFLFILTNLVYASMLIITIPKTMNFSNGMKLLDMMPTGYDWEYVNKLFETLGEKGREIYLYNQIPIDMIYPFLFGVSYCLVFAFILKKMNKLDTSYFYLSLLPIVAGVADYLENFGIISMLIGFPDLSQIVVRMTNLFTIIKSISTTIYFIGLIVILIAMGIRILNKRKTSVKN